MPDLLVKLYDLDFSNVPKELFNSEIKIVRALTLDKSKVLAFIRKYFNENWVNECEAAFSRIPVSCFLAVKNKAVIGFACYDVTAKGYFGPTGIDETNRGNGIGTSLLLSCMKDMWDQGYAYAIIGWTDEAIKFYQKTVNATIIENSSPGIYKRMIEL